MITAIKNLLQERRRRRAAARQQELERNAYFVKLRNSVRFLSGVRHEWSGGADLEHLSQHEVHAVLVEKLERLRATPRNQVSAKFSIDTTDRNGLILLEQRDQTGTIVLGRLFIRAADVEQLRDVAAAAISNARAM